MPCGALCVLGVLLAKIAMQSFEIGIDQVNMGWYFAACAVGPDTEFQCRALPEADGGVA
jgi:hypothetical protein